jgi:hypothetical protein
MVAAAGDEIPLDVTDLERVYSAAVYRATVNGRDVAFTFAGAPAGEPARLAERDWAIITAFNPGRRTLSPDDNLARNQRLRSELLARGLSFADSVASDARGLHREPGFMVLGVTMTEAIQLAAAFEQAAVVYGQGATGRCGFLFVDPPRWVEKLAVMCAIPPEPPPG